MPANIIWPATIPALDVARYTEVPGVQTLRTEMEEGPAKTRRLPTPESDRMQLEQIHTATETQILDTFYLTTLAGGSKRFVDTHPRTGASATLRFVGRPQFAHLSGPLWVTRFELEVLP